MTFDVPGNELPVIEVVFHKRQIATHEPGRKPNRAGTGEATMKTQTLCLTKRTPAFLFALALVVAGMLAGQRVAAQATASNTTVGQCNLAVVSKLSAATGPTCDEKAIRQMARQGQVYEQNQLGIASILAMGPGYNTEEAIKWFERAAQRGYAPAQVNLAVMYSNGWGTTVNYGKALHWLQAAADQGYARADYNLGILYLQGRGVRQDN